MHIKYGDMDPRVGGFDFTYLNLIESVLENQSTKSRWKSSNDSKLFIE
jgi:hypothetical protein